MKVKFKPPEKLLRITDSFKMGICFCYDLNKKIKEPEELMNIESTSSIIVCYMEDMIENIDFNKYYDFRFFNGSKTLKDLEENNKTFYVEDKNKNKIVFYANKERVQYDLFDNKFNKIKKAGD